MGLTHLIAAIATFLFIVLPFIAGFFFKNKLIAIRYILWSISIVFIVGFFINQFSKNSMERQDEKTIIGIYKIDVDSSKIDDVNLKMYSDLTLTVKSDNTIAISRPTPFIKRIEGQWRCKDDGDIMIIEYGFDDWEKTFQMAPADNQWILMSEDLNVQNNADQIIFRKKGSFFAP